MINATQQHGSSNASTPNRTLKGARATGLVAAFAVAGGAVLLSTVDDPAPDVPLAAPDLATTTSSATDVSPTASAAADDPSETLVLEVRPGETLDRLFRTANLSLGDLALILQSDVARANLRILKPGDAITIRHIEGRVMGLGREISIDQALDVARSEDGLSFAAQLVKLPLERREAEAAGVISRSLFESARDANISDPLVMKVAEIFAWDIDFVRDVGQGDSFTLIYDEIWRDGQKLADGHIIAAEFVNRGSRYTAVRFEGEDGKADYYTVDGRPMRKALLRAPLSFTRISSGFNPRRRHPILNTIRAHRGVDYAAPKGTPVKAAGDGKIIFKGWKSGYGNTVIIQHGREVTTLYAHLSGFGRSLRYGSHVRQGESIGYVGASGLATAPHLHYEYRRNGVHLDPRTVALPPADPLRGPQLTAFQGMARPLLDRLESRRALLAANQLIP